jgi:glutamyl-tRNA synthetase
MAVRDNLSSVAEAADWWQVCTTPITPVIEAAEVTTAAAGLLPDGDLSSDIWGNWTKAVAAETGAKGRGLFMPIRLALTGREKGPEIAPLLAFIGRERLVARLRGETA